MRILNISIKDFRNISRADINFGPINILTGKNSSGKSNFLLALSQAVSIDRDYSQVFSNNIVTHHPGKDLTTIKTKIGNFNTKVCYMTAEKKGFFCIDPKSFEFEKKIDKKTSSARSHKLMFSGRVGENVDINTVEDALAKSEKDFKYLDSEVVYEESFSENYQESNTKFVQLPKNVDPNREQYLNFFSDFQDTVISYVNGSVFSSNVIFEFITKKQSSEVYEQAIALIKKGIGEENEQTRLRTSSFDKAKFVLLLADIQRDERNHSSFKDDLKNYSNGILRDIYINTTGAAKGEIIVESPNGPKDVSTISSGTAILLFFILIKHWINLKTNAKSFKDPHVMIFDEIDSIVHPSLMDGFKEVLRSVSRKIQLFITTHSPYFIDGFAKTEVFLLKDNASIPGTKKLLNRCNIIDYQSVINQLPTDEDRKLFLGKSNSELFIGDLIDSIFPSHD